MNDSCDDYGLDSLLAKYQIPTGRWHHALEDSRMTADLWGRLMEEMEIRGVTALGDMYTHLSHA